MTNFVSVELWLIISTIGILKIVNIRTVPSLKISSQISSNLEIIARNKMQQLKSRMRAHLVLNYLKRSSISEAILKRLEELIVYLISNKKCIYIDSKIDKNSCQIIFDYPPHINLPKLVNSIKSVSSRKIREEFPEISEQESFWITKKKYGSPYTIYSLSAEKNPFAEMKGLISTYNSTNRN